MNYLIVIDMQYDFIEGALGSKEAVAILPAVKNKIDCFDGSVIFTRDTHNADYMETREGRLLPVSHCVKGSAGWQIDKTLDTDKAIRIFDKPTFGSVELMQFMAEENKSQPIGSITLIGICTDICVISNAMLLKTALPETDIIVDASCCAGVTPESHHTALNAMKTCQITVVGE